MELSIATLSDFAKNAQILFLKGLDTVQMAARNSGIFRVDSIPDHSGNTKEYSEIDLEEYAKKKPEGDQAIRAKVQQGYSVTGKLYRVALDIGITYEMRHYNKYMEVVSRLTNLGAVAGKRMELDLSHRITFATVTSYTDMDGDTISTVTGDGYQWAYTAHTVKGSSTTFRNRLANNPVFSKGALEGMEQLVVENSINQFGEKVYIPYDILWTTDDPNTINTVKEFLKSTAAPDAANSGVVNVYSGKYRHVILPRVATTATGAVDSTKAKYWGLASSSNSQAILAVNEEPRLKVSSETGNSTEFSTEDFNFGATAGYFIVTPGARSFTFSSGDGTA